MTASPLLQPEAAPQPGSARQPGSAAPVAALPRLAAVPAPVLNLPNVLTLGRLLVVPLFALLLLSAGSSDALRWWVTGLFVAACVTDVVDGRLARSRGQVTSFGIMVDPVADKALVGSALIGLSLLGLLPWWATVVVLGRELAVTALRVVVRRHGLMPATRGGKLKCLTQNAAVTLYLLPLAGVLAAVRLPLLVVAVAATVVTGLDYALRGWRLRRDALLA